MAYEVCWCSGLGSRPCCVAHFFFGKKKDEREFIRLRVLRRMYGWIDGFLSICQVCFTRLGRLFLHGKSALTIAMANILE